MTADPPTGRRTGNPSRDVKTVEGFGSEWSRFDQMSVDPAEQQRLFELYFRLFPWTDLPARPVGFDLGCGSGRWARWVAPRVDQLVCIDASDRALQVARMNAPQCRFVLASAGALPLSPASMDFGYSLGVLHHLPDPDSGLADAVSALKPGAPFLVYLYYALDNRRLWFRLLWRATDVARRGISRLPDKVRYAMSQMIAATVYLPLARLARLLARRGRDVDSIPLSAYRDRSFYDMRTDALDRFGTRLEKRFTRAEVTDMMERAGLDRVVTEGPPFWAAVGFKPKP